MNKRLFYNLYLFLISVQLVLLLSSSTSLAEEESLQSLTSNGTFISSDTADSASANPELGAITGEKSGQESKISFENLIGLSSIIANNTRDISNLISPVSTLSETTNFSKFEDAILGITINYPSDWKKKVANDQVVFTLNCT